MKPFTAQQAEILGSIQRLQQVITELQIQAAEKRCHAFTAAVVSVLVDKGILQPEEVQAALAHLEAGVAVDDALNPELQAAWDEIGRLFGDMLRERDRKDGE